METKQMVEEFVKKVDELKEEMLDENTGFILFAYNEQDKAQGNTYMVHGKIHAIAECMFTCMKSNDTLASIFISAANAYAQSKMMETKIDTKKKKKAN